MGKTKKKNQSVHERVSVHTSWKDDDISLHGMPLVDRIRVQVRSYETQDRNRSLRAEDRVHMLSLKKELKMLERREGASFTGHSTERTHIVDDSAGEGGYAY